MQSQPSSGTPSQLASFLSWQFSVRAGSTAPLHDGTPPVQSHLPARHAPSGVPLGKTMSLPSGRFVHAPPGAIEGSSSAQSSPATTWPSTEQPAIGCPSPSLSTARYTQTLSRHSAVAHAAGSIASAGQSVACSHARTMPASPPPSCCADCCDGACESIAPASIADAPSGLTSKLPSRLSHPMPNETAKRTKNFEARPT